MPAKAKAKRGCQRKAQNTEQQRVKHANKSRMSAKAKASQGHQRRVITRMPMQSPPQDDANRIAQLRLTDGQTNPAPE
jgi:hypothetical protein